MKFGLGFGFDKKKGGGLLFTRVQNDGLTPQFPAVSNGQVAADGAERTANLATAVFISQWNISGGDEFALLNSLNGTDIRLVDESNEANFVDLLSVTFVFPNPDFAIIGAVSFSIAWPTVGTNILFYKI